MGRKWQHLSPGELQMIQELHKTGMSNRMIANVIHRSRNFVTSALRNGEEVFEERRQRKKVDGSKCVRCGGSLPCLRCARERHEQRQVLVEEIDDAGCERYLELDLSDDMMERLREVRGRDKTNAKGARHAC